MDKKKKRYQRIADIGYNFELGWLSASDREYSWGFNWDIDNKNRYHPGFRLKEVTGNGGVVLQILSDRASLHQTITTISLDRSDVLYLCNLLRHAASTFSKLGSDILDSMAGGIE